GFRGSARMSEDERGAGAGTPGWLRHQGEDLSRLLSLSDGVFAFAFTLLVLQLTVPAIDTTGLTNGQISQRLAAALGGDVPAILAFAVGALFIGLQWVVHHRTFHYIRRFDSPLLWINIGFLATVAINPFLLGVFIRYQETSTAVMLYGGGQAVTVGLLALIWWYATWDRRLVDASLASRLIDY
ncbi:membrane protein containing DUF1211, partial [mine drainage metagenome]